MHIKNRGFTVLELLIVIALLGILAAIAYPRYEAYATRSKVSKVLKLADNDTNALSNYYAKNASMPKDRAAAKKAGIGLASASDSQYLAQNAGYQNAPGKNGAKNTVILKYKLANISSDVNNNTIELTSEIGNSQVQWHCTSAQISTKNLPSRCQSKRKQKH